MSKTSKSRKIYYRVNNFLPEQSQTLQQMLGTALRTQQKAFNRAQTVDAKASEFRLICQHEEVGNFLCGQFATFERGSYQIVIEDNQEANMLSLDAITPPLIGDKQSQFVPGVMYFAVFENHVAIIQDIKIRASVLEQHLAWLLRDKCNLIDSKVGICLKDEAPLATQDRIRKAHVKNILVNRTLMNDTFVQSSDTEESKGKFKPNQGFLTLLKDLIPDTEQFEKLGLQNNVFDDSLEAIIGISFPKRQRNKEINSIQLLDNLGILLRDTDEDRVKLELSDGSIVQGKNFIVSSTIEMEVNDKGLPDKTELYANMCTWLTSQIRNGNVAP